MKYLCLAYEAEETFNTTPREEWDAVREETLAYVDALKRSGHLLDARPLRSASTAATLKVRNGRLTVTDGPQRYRKRMGWTLPWYSSANNDFNIDIGVTTDKGEDHRVNVFLLDGDDIYYTYYTSARGTETLRSTWGLLDITPFGRQEDWEDSPAGWPQTLPYQWWRRHDEYGARS